MKKNAASQSIGAQMITAADGTNFTGAVSVSVTIDNGTQTAGGGTAPAHEGNGYHSYTPTQAETNGDHIAFTFTGTGAITSTVQVYTTYPQSADNNTILVTLPTQAYLDGRTLASAAYFDPAADTVANVTTVATTTNLTNLPSIPANWITATGIAAAALNGKGDWNIGKTGYTLTQTFPGNFADLAITAATGLVDITQAAADKVWSTATRELSSGTNIVLAKGVGLTGLNDIAATEIVSGGAITTSAGAVSTVTTCATNADMRGTDNALLASGYTAAPTAAQNATAVLTTQMTESYAADGVAPTLAQAVFLTMQNLQDFSFTGTTQTVKKLDGTTAAATYTLDDAATPTSKTRAS